MDKQNDNIITRETIKKLLLIQNKDSVHDTWALTGVMSFLLVPGLLVSIWFLSEYIKIQWLKVLLCVFAAVLITAPMWVNLLSLRTLSKEKEMIYNDDFDIVVREVSYKSDRLVGRRHRLVEYLHFEGFKKVSVGRTLFKLTSYGDEFYIICFRGSDNIQLLYSSKMYKYKSM